MRIISYLLLYAPAGMPVSQSIGSNQGTALWPFDYVATSLEGCLGGDITSELTKTRVFWFGRQLALDLS